jgi:pilus assembly protein CpaB
MAGFKEMKTENKLLLIAAVSGLAAAALAFLFISGKEESIMRQMDGVAVVAAAKYIPAWTKIDDTMIKYLEIPRKYVTKAHILKMDALKGQISMVPFIENEPVLMNKLTEKGEQLNVAIPSGLRAVTVAVDEESGVGYMIKPGDSVDVILSYQDKSADQKLHSMVTATVLQDVRVVAVGNDFSFTKKDSSYSSITLAMTPEESELLIFAREKGRISFSLRAIGDKTKEKIRTTEFEDLMKQIKKNEKGDETAEKGYKDASGENMKENAPGNVDAQIKKRGE